MQCLHPQGLSRPRRNIFITVKTDWKIRFTMRLTKIKVMLYQLKEHSASEKTGSTEWHTKCHTIDCTHNTFLLLQKHLTSGTELILIGWKIVPNEEHV
jgi:hypothetical protein